MRFKLFFLPKQIIILGMSLFLFASCNSKPRATVSETDTFENKEKRYAENEARFTERLEAHLEAVRNRDLESLKKTLSPKGNMLLILPKMEMTTTVADFLENQAAWFKEPNWTFETKIVATEVGVKMGMAVVEAIYREPNVKGKPYFNRMNISYDLKKYNGQWYVIKDQMCSIEKSTDTNE